MAERRVSSVERVSGRHLRRGPSWWLRRAAVLLLVAVAGVAAGAGAALLFDAADDDEVTAGPTGAAGLVPDAGPVTLVIAGEIRAGGALGGRLYGGADPVGPFAEVLGEADLAVVGLPAPVTDDEAEAPDGSARVPSAVLDGLEEVGIDVVGVASDAILDLGDAGVAATVAARDGRRLALVGVGADEASAYAAARRTVGGVEVAVISATQLLAPDRIAAGTAGPEQAGVASAKRVDRLVAEVQAASEDADVVVVYLSWGEAGETCPSAGQGELATALVDAGADVVAGSGSGRVQGAGRLGPAVVAFGLGTLVGDGAEEAGALAVEVEGGEITGWRWLAGRVVDGVAEPTEADDALAADLAERQACAGLVP